MICRRGRHASMAPGRVLDSPFDKSAYPTRQSRSSTKLHDSGVHPSPARSFARVPVQARTSVERRMAGGARLRSGGSQSEPGPAAWLQHRGHPTVDRHGRGG